MKHLGKAPRRCPCQYCTGRDDSKPIHKALKKKGRQAQKKELKKITDSIKD